MKARIHIDTLEEPTKKQYFKTLCGLTKKERYLERAELSRFATCPICLSEQKYLAMKQPVTEPSEVSRRRRLIFELSTMPEEAFGWFVAWASGQMIQFPDGLGGFMDDSRESIERMRKEAKKYMEQA